MELVSWRIDTILSNHKNCHLYLSFYITANITVAPVSLATPLNMVANFTCEGTGGILIWTVQSHSLTDPSNQNREISVSTENVSIGVWSSILSIKALPINDGIRIGCTVIGKSFDIVSKGASLTVKGS